MPGVSIQSATQNDLSRVLRLWTDEGGPTKTPPTADSIRRLIDFDPSALLVARDEGDVVGTVVVGWDGWRCHLYRLVVDPHHRRRRVATDLIRAACQRAEALGARRVDAMVDPSNEIAQHVWRSAGFERDADQRWSTMLAGVRP